MYRRADLVAEDAVDELMLLDPAEPGEALRDDLRAEVVTAAGEILDGHLCTGQRARDSLLELLGRGHA